MFPCPGCQRDIDLGERGINGLFRNFTLETIVERYRQAARAAIAIMCDFCKPPPQESTKSCMDCSASYCNECFKVHHPWGTVKAQHEYVGPTTNFRPKVSKNLGFSVLRTYLKGTLQIRIFFLIWEMVCVTCDLRIFSFFFLIRLSGLEHLEWKCFSLKFRSRRMTLCGKLKNAT